MCGFIRFYRHGSNLMIPSINNKKIPINLAANGFCLPQVTNNFKRLPLELEGLRKKR